MDIEQTSDLRPVLVEFRKTILDATKTFEPRRGFNHFLPNPSGGSANKRLNMWLRWMVRGPDAVDLGAWSFLGHIASRCLWIPMYIALHNISRFNQTKPRRLKTAVEVTDALRQLEPADPLKYDFALAHLGIEWPMYSEYNVPKSCQYCDLRSICTLPAS